MVAELRAKTDAPMMECKKALTEAEGDSARAEEILRVKLGNKASKAASRIAAEGVVTAAVSGSTGALVEVNCETDFVTKNDAFLAFSNACATLVKEHNPADVAALSALPYAQDGFGPTLVNGNYHFCIHWRYQRLCSRIASFKNESCRCYSGKLNVLIYFFKFAK